ncbi:MAG: hypothetical protein HQL28_01170 [Candidatus Omnitrophica bacterium]|nr:hypothetical protein [Candidatus Omnitrophota bacterium]
MEANETYRHFKKTAANTRNANKKSNGSMPHITPAEVATPFPPLNFKKTVQICPDITLKASSIFTRNSCSTVEAEKWNRIIGIKVTAMYPLKKSIRRTSTPQILPTLLNVLVAPTLPLPTLLMSISLTSFPKI